MSYSQKQLHQILNHLIQHTRSQPLRWVIRIFTSEIAQKITNQPYISRNLHIMDFSGPPFALSYLVSTFDPSNLFTPTPHAIGRNLNFTLTIGFYHNKIAVHGH
eukprot:TRINITY_DN42924_c1_g1_i1.p1 TRINITY_DN42924_c1_g1~~TRINITY_DN42924_c1_g1_i1.p1  ORF type:complete len:104 (+),score=5.79 TRINITY_DN42924_c1_g1_i1:717-1028(+)